MALGIVLAALAGTIGAAAWTHTEGWYVTFMTGNTERMVLEHYKTNHLLGISALATVLFFVLGVVLATLARVFLWRKASHGATLVTAAATYGAWAVDALTNDSGAVFGVAPVLALALGLGALNTSISRDNQVVMPLSYVTGTLVKLGQGVALHLAGVQRWVWVSQAVTYAGFLVGAALGGAVLHAVPSGAALASLAGMTTVVAVVTWRLDHPAFSFEDAHGSNT
ncbi:YoaK family protein [Kocuria sp.]|uniref:YoaK family protein n=1 Tax=Kocuria sp. TaxID=1871328 RepID=UPI0026DA8C2D|nr:YoaK family protein [Kocuria sp.]MDO4918019.1 YoaK family protein [Kocuria sp.]